MRIAFLDFSVTFFTRIIVLLAALGGQSCLAWVLGPSGRGAYAVSLLFTVILTLIFLLGCDTACSYFVAAKQFTLSEGLVYACIYSTVGSILAIIAGLFILQFPFEFLTKATPEQFYIALVAIPCSVFSAALVRLFIALKEISCFSQLTVFGAASNLLFTVVLVWLFQAGVEGALIANILSELVVIVLAFYFLRTRFQVGWASPNLNGMKKIALYGSKYYLGKVSNQTNVQLGTMILAFFSTQAEIGMFALASRLMSQVMIIPDSLTKVLSPRIAGDLDGRKELVAQCFRLTLFSCGLLLLGLALLAHPLVAVLFSPAFLPMVTVIQILAIGVTLRCGSKILEPYLLGTNRPGTASLSMATGALINLGLLYIFLPRLGINGAAIGVVGSYLATFLFLCFSFLRHSGLEIRDISWPRKSDFNFVRDSFKGLGRPMIQKPQVEGSPHD